MAQKTVKRTTGLLKMRPNEKSEATKGIHSLGQLLDWDPLFKLKERPSRTAKLVCYIDMGSSPGGGDYRTMLIDRGRDSWRLWLKLTDYDTGKSRFCTMAFASPKSAFDVKSAAEAMLSQLWRDESVTAFNAVSEVSVMEEGILSSADIYRIFEATWKA